MKYILSALGLATAVAAHGYVDNATIAGKSYQFYQPYTDPYTSPTPDRISRPVQGNGPVTDVTYNDLQCGGYKDGGVDGSSPAKLHAEVAAGSEVELFWTLWPESHVGPVVTYMAACPSSGCNNYMPGTRYDHSIFSTSHSLTQTTALYGSRSNRKADRALPTPGATLLS